MDEELFNKEIFEWMMGDEPCGFSEFNQKVDDTIHIECVDE